MNAHSPDYLARFSGIARLYGEASLQRFSEAKVAVIGLGGVGSWSVEALARSGVGSLTLIDLDDICISNTNRQLHTVSATVGSLKAEAMKERVLAINPECNVNSVAQFVTAKSVANWLTPEHDFIIDAIDVVRHKCAIIAYCQRAKIKLLTIGGAGGLTDPTQIKVADLSRTFHDPLLAKVRKKLRQDYQFSSNPKRRFGITSVFSSEQAIYPNGYGGVGQCKPGPNDSARLDCASGFGAASSTTGSFGFVAAAEVLKRLTHSP